MDNQNHIPDPQEPTPEEFREKPLYVPRPKWQLVAAWAGLAIFLTIVVLYYALMFKG